MSAGQFVETSDSRQAASLDRSGYLRTSRTFKVIGLNPDDFFKPGTIANIQPLGGSGVMPDYGALWGVQNQSEGVETKVVLNEYLLRPISATMFYAIAQYSNDPKLSPLGLGYQGSSRYSIVQIPYVRILPIIAAGASGPTNISYQPMSLGISMSIQRIEQTVNVLRSNRKAAEQISRTQTGKLTDLPELGLCLYEGHSINLLSPQYCSITYTWKWEGGILSLGPPPVTGPHDTPITALYPTKVTPVDTRVSFGRGGLQFVLPPYHTIEMMFALEGDPLARVPFWAYRMPYPIGGPVTSFVGSSNFEFYVQ